MAPASCPGISGSVPHCRYISPSHYMQTSVRRDMRHHGRRAERCWSSGEKDPRQRHGACTQPLMDMPSLKKKQWYPLVFVHYGCIASEVPMHLSLSMSWYLIRGWFARKWSSKWPYSWKCSSSWKNKMFKQVFLFHN